jgi:hypothetical protein
MTETERYMSESLKPTYEEEFIKRRFLGCFVDYAFVVIKKRTLLVYKSEFAYKESPDQPESFFNLSFLICTLKEDSLRLSNDFAELTLRHHESGKLLELVQAIENGRTMVGPMNLYPKKFVYFDSGRSS